MDDEIICRDAASVCSPDHQHQFIFEDQNGAEINNGESITVIEGGTIAETVFATRLCGIPG